MTGLVLLLGANGVAATAFFAAAGPSGDTLTTVGRLTGLYAALLLVCQLVLIARIPWLDRRIGMDRLLGWHRWTGIGLVWLLIAHAVAIWAGYGISLVTLAETVPGVLRAIVAFGLVMAVGVLSARFARRKLAYETWHFIHLYAYAAVFLAFSHQITLGQSFAGSPMARIYWWILWASAVAAVLSGRVALPLWRNLKHRFRVSAVVAEAPDVVSVYVTGRRLAELPVRAGQFFFWRFLTRDRWWQANPFSLSATPDGESLRLTAKALGSGSAGLRTLAPGTRVFAEGPYGAFTVSKQRRPDALLIAGGIGITPIRALIGELPGRPVLIYRVGKPSEAVLLSELDDADVHVLVGPPDARNEHGPLLGAENLRALVPDIGERDVFVCGPPGMMRAVMASLRELRVPREQVHAERFSLTR